MAERSSELENLDRIDPVPPPTVAESGHALAERSGDYTVSEAHKFGAAPVSDADQETEHIKAQIEETRSNMGETIDAIQDRLSFANISEQVSEQVNNAIETAKDTVYDATMGKAVNFMKNAGNELSHSSIVTAAKDNPLPFLLIGVGAGLLAYNSLGKKQRRSLSFDRQIGDKSFDRHLDDNAAGRSGYSDPKRSLTASAQQTASGVKDSVSNAAATAYDGVAGAAGSVYSGAGDIAGRAYDIAGEFGTKAQETYSEYLEEKPWAIGAVALIAGAAVGLAIPSTRYEGELMGEARVNLMSKAKDAAGDLVDKAKDVAAEAGKTIKDEVNTATQPEIKQY